MILQRVRSEGMGPGIAAPPGALKTLERHNLDIQKLLASLVPSTVPGRTRYPEKGILYGGTCAGARGRAERCCGVRRLGRLEGFLTCPGHPQFAYVMGRVVHKDHFFD